jgi:hypothetical protein
MAVHVHSRVVKSWDVVHDDQDFPLIKYNTLLSESRSSLNLLVGDFGCYTLHAMKTWRLLESIKNGGGGGVSVLSCSP